MGFFGGWEKAGCSTTCSFSPATEKVPSCRKHYCQRAGSDATNIVTVWRIWRFRNTRGSYHTHHSNVCTFENRNVYPKMWSIAAAPTWFAGTWFYRFSNTPIGRSSSLNSKQSPSMANNCNYLRKVWEFQVTNGFWPNFYQSHFQQCSVYHLPIDRVMLVLQLVAN